MKYSIALLALATVAQAQQRTIPVRTLTPVLSVAPTTFGATAIRPLSNGSVFVNDTRYRRLYLFDSTLTKYTVVFDSVADAANSYGPGPSPMIAFVGDTSLMLDLSSQALLVIDPAGKLVRTIAQPSNTNPVGPAAKGDQKGRLIYRGRGGGPGVDSVLLVRADIANRTLDTVGVLRLPMPKSDTVRNSEGNMVSRPLFNPMQATDDWTVLSDGSLAIVRVRDYHIDWVRPDGKRESTAKMPLDWRRLTDAEKQQIADSMQKQFDGMFAGMGAGPLAAGAAAGGRGDGGGGGRGGGVAVGRGGGEGDVRAGPPPRPGVIPAKDLPDFVPPIRLNTLRADLDGNLWIPPVTTVLAAPGEIVYDVINNRGEIFERVRVPIGKSIAGFGKGGVLYLASGTAASGFTIERVKVVR